MTRPVRDLLRSAALALIATASLATSLAAETAVEMHRTSGCSCCLLWVKRMEAEGFKVTVKDAAMGQLMRMKLDAGLKADQASCHTSKIGGYVVEGHVPPRDIKRLLSERPDAVGITVPGMPLGSPGMEAGDKKDAYDVLLFRKNGPTEVYASYPVKN